MRITAHVPGCRRFSYMVLIVDHRGFIAQFSEN